MDDRHRRETAGETTAAERPPLAPQDPKLPEMLQEFLEASLKMPLTKEYLRGGSASREETKPNLTSLKDELGFDSGGYSRWLNGKEHKDGRSGEHLKITEQLTDFFNGRNNDYLSKDKDRQKKVRAFRAELIGHWNATRPDLIAGIVDRLNAHKAYLRKQEEIEANAKLRDLLVPGKPSLGARTSPDSQYVQRLTQETVPSSLHPIYQAFGREQIVDLLVNYFAAPESRNRLVILNGPKSSGKSAVIRAVVGDLARRAEANDEQPSLLYVDLAVAESPQRALYLALGGRSGAKPSGITTASFDDDGSEDDADRDAAEWREAISYVRSALPPPDPRAGRVVIFEGYPQIAANEESSRQIRALIEQTCIKAGFVLVEAQGGGISVRALAPSNIHLPPLESNQAVKFLTGPCNVPTYLAEPAIADLVELDEILHPGPLNFGSSEFRSDTLEFRPEAPNPQDLSMSILNAATGLAEMDVLAVLRQNEDAAQEAIQSLMAMSVIAMVPVCGEVLSQSGLGPVPHQALRRMGWFSSGENFQLVGFALQVLRAAAARRLAGAKGRGTDAQRRLEEDVKRLLLVVGSDRRVNVDPAIEEAAAWLDRSVPQDNPLLIHLRALLYQASVHDDVSPLSEEKEIMLSAELEERATEDLDLDKAIGRLVIAARARASSITARRDNFLTSLDALINVLQDNVQFSLRQLTALDGALYYGVVRYQLIEQILKARRRVLEILDGAGPDHTQAEHEGQKSRFIQEAEASFKINTAEILASSGESEAAHKIAAQIDATLERIPEAERNSFTYWKMARAAILRSRLAQEIGGRCREMELACLHAQDCLRAAPQDTRNSRFLLRTVGRFVDLEASTEPRQKMMDSSIALLVQSFGEPENWSGELRGRVASLLRRTVRLERSVEARKAIARQAMGILLPPGTTTRDNDLDALGLLAKARLHAILDENKAALQICRDLTERQPFVEAWMLRLRLEDGGAGEADEASATTVFDLVESAQISGSLRTAMSEAEKWAKNLPEMELQQSRVARLLLWIKSRRWKEVGSIERVVRDQVEQEGMQFDRMRLEHKLDRLDKEHRMRESALNGIGRLCKRSVDLVYARARNCGQFVRSQAVLSGKEPDVSMVLTVYDRGLREMPNSAELMFQRAEYSRYIWRTKEAIVGFRDVLSKAHRAELRQAAALSLAKTLHITAVELADLTDQERLDRLAEAKALVNSLSDSPEKVPEILLLKEHLAFELGENVDWIRLDAVCEKVAAEADAYLPTLLQNLEVLKLEDDEVPRDIADALIDNFTSREVLGSVAQLYFRRGVKGDGNDAQSYFTRAVSLHCAVAMLERSWLRTELATTRFQLGRTISVAAERLGNPNPIEHLWIGKADNQLRFAGSKIHAAVMASSGEFRDVAKKWQGIVSRQWQAMGA